MELLKDEALDLYILTYKDVFKRYFFKNRELLVNILTKTQWQHLDKNVAKDSHVVSLILCLSPKENGKGEKRQIMVILRV